MGGAGSARATDGVRPVQNTIFSYLDNVSRSGGPRVDAEDLSSSVGYGCRHAASWAYQGRGGTPMPRKRRLTHARL